MFAKKTSDSKSMHGDSINTLTATTGKIKNDRKHKLKSKSDFAAPQNAQIMNKVDKHIKTQSAEKDANETSHRRRHKHRRHSTENLSTDLNVSKVLEDKQVQTARSRKASQDSSISKKRPHTGVDKATDPVNYTANLIRNSQLCFVLSTGNNFDIAKNKEALIQLEGTLIKSKQKIHKKREARPSPVRQTETPSLKQHDSKESIPKRTLIEGFSYFFKTKSLFAKKGVDAAICEIQNSNKQASDTPRSKCIQVEVNGEADGKLNALSKTRSISVDPKSSRRKVERNGEADVKLNANSKTRSISVDPKSSRRIDKEFVECKNHVSDSKKKHKRNTSVNSEPGQKNKTGREDGNVVKNLSKSSNKQRKDIDVVITKKKREKSSLRNIQKSLSSTLITVESERCQMDEASSKTKSREQNLRQKQKTNKKSRSNSLCVTESETRKIQSQNTVKVFRSELQTKDDKKYSDLSDKHGTHKEPKREASKDRKRELRKDSKRESHKEPKQETKSATKVKSKKEKKHHRHDEPSEIKTPNSNDSTIEATEPKLRKEKHRRHKQRSSEKQCKNASGRNSETTLDTIKITSSEIKVGELISDKREVLKVKSRSSFSEKLAKNFNFSSMYDEKTKAYNIPQDQLDQFVQLLKVTDTQIREAHTKNRKSQDEEDIEVKVDRNEVSFSKLNLQPMIEHYQVPQVPKPFYSWQKEQPVEQKSPFLEILTEKEKCCLRLSPQHSSPCRTVLGNVVECGKKTVHRGQECAIEFTVEGVEPPTMIRAHEAKVLDLTGNNTKQLHVSVLSMLEITPSHADQDKPQIKVKPQSSTTPSRIKIDDCLKKSLSDSESSAIIGKVNSKLSTCLPVYSPKKNLSRGSLSRRESHLSQKPNIKSNTTIRNQSRISFSNDANPSNTIFQSESQKLPNLSNISSEDCDLAKNGLDKEDLANLGHQVLTMMQKYFDKYSCPTKEDPPEKNNVFSAVGEDFFTNVKKCIQERLKPVTEEVSNTRISDNENKFCAKKSHRGLTNELSAIISQDSREKVENYLRGSKERQLTFVKRKGDIALKSAPRASLHPANKFKAKQNTFIRSKSANANGKDGHAIKPTVSGSSRGSSKQSLGSKKSSEYSLAMATKSNSSGLSSGSKNDYMDTSSKNLLGKTLAESKFPVEVPSPTVLIYDYAKNENNSNSVIEEVDLLPNIAEETASQNSVARVKPEIQLVQKQLKPSALSSLKNVLIDPKKLPSNEPLQNRSSRKLLQDKVEPSLDQGQDVTKKELDVQLKMIAQDMSAKVMQIFQMTSNDLSANGDLSSESRTSHFSDKFPKRVSKKSSKIMSGSCSFIKKNIRHVDKTYHCDKSSSNASSITADSTCKKFSAFGRSFHTTKKKESVKLENQDTKPNDDENKTPIDDLIRLTNLLKDDVNSTNNIEKANLLDKIITQNISSILNQQKPASPEVKTKKKPKSFEIQKTVKKPDSASEKKQLMLEKLQALIADDNNFSEMESKLNKLFTKESKQDGKQDVIETVATPELFIGSKKESTSNEKRDPSSSLKKEPWKTFIKVDPVAQKKRTTTPVRDKDENVSNKASKLEIVGKVTDQQIEMAKRPKTAPSDDKMSLYNSTIQSVTSKRELTGKNSKIPRFTNLGVNSINKFKIGSSAADRTTSKVSVARASVCTKPSAGSYKMSSVITKGDKPNSSGLSNFEKRKLYDDSIRNKKMISKSEANKLCEVVSQYVRPYEVLYVTSEGPLLHPCDPLTKYINNFDEPPTLKKGDEYQRDTYKITYGEKLAEDKLPETDYTPPNKFPTEPAIKANPVERTRKRRCLKRYKDLDSVRLEEIYPTHPVATGNIFSETDKNENTHDLNFLASKSTTSLSFNKTKSKDSLSRSSKSFQQLNTSRHSSQEAVTNCPTYKRKTKLKNVSNAKHFLGDKNNKAERVLSSPHQSKFLLRKVRSFKEIRKACKNNYPKQKKYPCRGDDNTYHHNPKLLFEKCCRSDGKKFSLKKSRTWNYRNIKKTVTSVSSLSRKQNFEGGKWSKLIRNKLPKTRNGRSCVSLEREQIPERFHSLRAKAFKCVSYSTGSNSTSSSYSFSNRSSISRSDSVTNSSDSITTSSEGEDQGEDFYTVFNSNQGTNGYCNYDSDDCYKIFAYNSVIQQPNCQTNSKVALASNKATDVTSNTLTLYDKSESGYESNMSKTVNSLRKFNLDEENILKRFTDFTNFHFKLANSQTFCVYPLEAVTKRRQYFRSGTSSRQSDSGNYSTANQASLIPCRKCRTKKTDEEISANPAKVCFKPCVRDTSTSAYYYPGAPEMKNVKESFSKCSNCIQYHKRHFKHSKKDQTRTCYKEDCSKSGKLSSTTDDESTCTDESYCKEKCKRLCAKRTKGICQESLQMKRWCCKTSNVQMQTNFSETESKESECDDSTCVRPCTTCANDFCMESPQSKKPSWNTCDSHTCTDQYLKPCTTFCSRNKSYVKPVDSTKIGCLPICVTNKLKNLAGGVSKSRCSTTGTYAGFMKETNKCKEYAKKVRNESDMKKDGRYKQLSDFTEIPLRVLLCKDPPKGCNKQTCSKYTPSTEEEFPKLNILDDDYEVSTQNKKVNTVDTGSVFKAKTDLRLVVQESLEPVSKTSELSIQPSNKNINNMSKESLMEIIKEQFRESLKEVLERSKENVFKMSEESETITILPDRKSPSQIHLSEEQESSSNLQVGSLQYFKNPNPEAASKDLTSILSEQTNSNMPEEGNTYKSEENVPGGILSSLVQLSEEEEPSSNLPVASLRDFETSNLEAVSQELTSNVSQQANLDVSEDLNIALSEENIPDRTLSSRMHLSKENELSSKIAVASLRDIEATSKELTQNGSEQANLDVSEDLNIALSEENIPDRTLSSRMHLSKENELSSKIAVASLRDIEATSKELTQNGSEQANLDVAEESNIDAFEENVPYRTLSSRNNLSEEEKPKEASKVSFAGLPEETPLILSQEAIEKEPQQQANESLSTTEYAKLLSSESCNCWNLKNLPKEVLLKLKEEIDNRVNSMLEPSNQNAGRVDSLYEELNEEPIQLSKNSNKEFEIMRNQFCVDIGCNCRALPMTISQDPNSPPATITTNPSVYYNEFTNIPSRDSSFLKRGNRSALLYLPESSDQSCSDFTCHTFNKNSPSMNSPTKSKRFSSRTSSGSEPLTSLKDVINTTFTSMLNSSKEALDISSKEAHCHLLQSLNQLSCTPTSPVLKKTNVTLDSFKKTSSKIPKSKSNDGDYTSKKIRTKNLKIKEKIIQVPDMPEASVDTRCSCVGGKSPNVDSKMKGPVGGTSLPQFPFIPLKEVEASGSSIRQTISHSCECDLYGSVVTLSSNSQNLKEVDIQCECFLAQPQLGLTQHTASESTNQPTVSESKVQPTASETKLPPTDSKFILQPASSECIIQPNNSELRNEHTVVDFQLALESFQNDDRERFEVKEILESLGILIESHSQEILNSPSKFLTMSQEELAVVDVSSEDVSQQLNVAFNRSLMTVMKLSQHVPDMVIVKALGTCVNNLINELSTKTKPVVNGKLVSALLSDAEQNLFDKPFTMFAKVVVVMAVQKLQKKASKVDFVSDKILLDMAKVSLEAIVQLHKKFFPKKNANASFKFMVEELYTHKNFRADRTMSKSQLKVLNLIKQNDLATGKKICYCKGTQQDEQQKINFSKRNCFCKETQQEQDKISIPTALQKSQPEAFIRVIETFEEQDLQGTTQEASKSETIGPLKQEGPKTIQSKQEGSQSKATGTTKQEVFKTKAIGPLKQEGLKTIQSKQEGPQSKATGTTTQEVSKSQPIAPFKQEGPETSQSKQEDLKSKAVGTSQNEAFKSKAVDPLKQEDQKSKSALEKLRKSFTDKEMFEKMLVTYNKEEDIVERLSQDEEFFRSQLELVISKESIETMLKSEDTNPITLNGGNNKNAVLQMTAKNDGRIDKKTAKPKIDDPKPPDIDILVSESNLEATSSENTKTNKKANRKSTFRNKMSRLFNKHDASVKEIVAPRDEDAYRKQSIDLSYLSKRSTAGNDAQNQSMQSSIMSSMSRVRKVRSPDRKLVGNRLSNDSLYPLQALKNSNQAITLNPSEIGRCFLRGFRTDNVTLSGKVCLTSTTPEEEAEYKGVVKKVSIIDFSERETALDFLLALGFSIDEASNAIKDEDVKARLSAAITEARIWINKIKCVQGTLLYLIAYKAKPRIMRYYLQLVEAIINARINNAVKLDAFLKILEKVEDGDLVMINILGTDNLQDEDNNDEKMVKKQLREIFVTVYNIADEETKKRDTSVTKRQLALLRILAAKYRAGLNPHLELIAKYIGQELLITEVQLEAAMIYLSRLDTVYINLEEFETYCAIDCNRMNQ